MPAVKLFRSIPSALVLLTLLAACGQTGPPGAQQSHQASAPSPATATQGSPSAAASPGLAFSHPVLHPSPDAPSPGTATLPHSGSRPAPKRSSKPFENQVPVTASIDPACVSPGAAVTLSVHTQPKAYVIYQAIYSDGGSGAAPPYGKGYGGNAGGVAGPDGTYQSAWVVAANAPPVLRTSSRA